MTSKEIRALDKLISELSEKSDIVWKIRQTTGINPGFSFTRESEIIEYLYVQVLDLRKKLDTPFITASTSGWTVDYIREKRKYKKDEKYNIRASFSFVWTDTYE
jgi:hypothetical protein